MTISLDTDETVVAPATTLPLVSVITIFYNAEKYFVEAIESVIAQDYPRWELLLADDGSRDSGTAIAKDYAARYPGQIRYLEHPGHVNRGMSPTRNLGIGEARGELIAFIDADDVWAPTKLSEQVAIMRDNPEVGLVAGAVRYWASWEGLRDEVVPTGHAQNRVIRQPEASLNLYPLGRAAAPCPSDLLLRADLVRSLGGFEEHFGGPRQMYEDQGFLSKLYLAAPVYFSDKVWLNYRTHADSCVASVTRDGRYGEVRGYFLTWLQGYIDDRPQVPDEVRALLRKARSRHRLATAVNAARSPVRALRRTAGAVKRALLGRRSGAGASPVKAP